MEPTVFKVAITGSASVGKFSFAFRLAGRGFEDVRMTPGELLFKRVSLENIDYGLEFIVTPSADVRPSRLNTLTSESDGFFLVFDITNAQSFHELHNHYYRILDIKKSQGYAVPPIVVVGLKSDLDPERVISSEQGQRVANEFKAKYIEASAKAGTGLRECLEAIVQSIASRQTASIVARPCCLVV